MANQYVRYSPEVEVFLEDEGQIIAGIMDTMRHIDTRTYEKYGHHVRSSHAKSHGLAAGTLKVADNLPEHLAQGLFSNPATYPVVVRLSNLPGEVISDAVNTQRGLAFKILDIDGPMMAGHEGQHTQDFVLDSGNRFGLSDAKAFLMQQRVIEYVPLLPEKIKETVSDIARATNKVLHKIGLENANLDVLGHALIHPMAEAYFSQVAMRYGDYIAKFAVVPVTEAQKGLKHTKTDGDKDPNALSQATVNYLRDHDAVFDLRIQLCTDLKKMPVEDATKEWSEEDSPYQTVARLSLPRQEAYSEARQKYIESLSFSPAHCLQAHQPLGSIMRARLTVYQEMSKLRRKGNRQSVTEPNSIDEVPA